MPCRPLCRAIPPCLRACAGRVGHLVAAAGPGFRHVEAPDSRNGVVAHAMNNLAQFSPVAACSGLVKCSSSCFLAAFSAILSRTCKDALSDRLSKPCQTTESHLARGCLCMPCFMYAGIRSSHAVHKDEQQSGVASIQCRVPWSPTDWRHLAA